MDILLSRGTPRVPQLRSPPAPGVSKQVIWCVSIVLGPYSSSHLCVPRLSVSLILDLTALSPSPTGPSPTQASSPTHAIYREADRALTCAYCLLSFPICPLGSHSIAASHCFFFPDDALNPPSSSPPPHPRRHVFIAGIAVSTSGHQFSSSSKHHPRSIIVCLRQTTGPSFVAKHVKYVHNASDSQRNSNPNPSHTHQQHYERCYDYDPIRCRSAVVIALLAYVIVSHHNSTVTSNRPYARSILSVARCMGMK